jgi:hypothetical protein
VGALPVVDDEYHRRLLASSPIATSAWRCFPPTAFPPR